MIQRVISGGQVGADIAGLRAAKSVGIETGGWMPRGWRTKDGPHPEYADIYGMTPAGGGGYRVRTGLNVYDADATVRLAYDFTSAGTRLTGRLCRDYDRPHYDVRLFRPPGHDLPASIAWLTDPGWDVLAEWLDQRPEIRTLNVAGNGDPHIEVVVESYLTATFLNLRGGS